MAAAKTLKIGSRVRAYQGRWSRATGRIVRWWRDPRANLDTAFSPGVAFHGAEFELDPEFVGKFAGPAITVLVSRFENLEKI